MAGLLRSRGRPKTHFGQLSYAIQRIRYKILRQRHSRHCPWSRSLHCPSQLVEEDFRVFKVGGIEALSEPVVDFGKHRARFIAAAGIASQPRETRRRS